MRLFAVSRHPASQFLRRRLRLLFRFGPYVALRLPRGRSGKPASIRSLWFKPLKRRLWFRPDETDSDVFHQVFVNEQYSISLKRSPKTIVDAGANVGFTTLFFASQYPNARIIAIEPSPRSVELLRMNVAGLPNVTIVEAALWAKTEDLLFEDIPGRSWGAHVDQKGTYRVSGISMLDLLDRHNLSNIDLLKMDVEGAEKEIFEQAQSDWLDRVAVMQIELHDGIKPGCAAAFYRAISKRDFTQTTRGEIHRIMFQPDKSELAIPMHSVRTKS